MSSSPPPPDQDAIDEGWDALDVPAASPASVVHPSAPPMEIGVTGAAGPSTSGPTSATPAPTPSPAPGSTPVAGGAPAARRKTKLPAKSREQVAAQAGKKAAKKAAKVAARRARAQNNRAASLAAAAQRSKRGAGAAHKTPRGRAQQANATGALGRSPAAPSDATGARTTSRETWWGRATAGPIPLVVITLLMLAGLSWFLWPRG